MIHSAASNRLQRVADGCGVIFTVATLAAVALNVSRDLTPFSWPSILVGTSVLFVISVAIWALSRIRALPAAPLALVPAFFVGTGNVFPFLAWATLITASVVLGRLAVERIGVLRPLQEALSPLGAALVVGLSANSFAVWGAMHLPINTPLTYWSFFFAEILCCVVLRSGPVLPKLSWSPARYVILAYALFVIPYAVVPSYNHDDLTTHLFLPHQTAMFGRFEFTPHEAATLNVCIIPIGAYTGVFIMGGENALRLVNISMFIFGFLILESFVRRRWNSGVALTATLLGVLFPITCWTIGIVFTDSSLFFFSCAFLIVAWEFMERRDSSWLPALGLLAGLGYLAKQQIIFIVIPLSMLCGLVVLRLLFQEPARTIRYLLFAFALFAAVLAPPMLRNYVLSGNPIYPFYNGVFRSPYWPSIDLKDNRWSQPFGLSTLWAMSFKGPQFVENIKYSFGFSLLVFSPLLLLRSTTDLLRRQRAAALLVLVTIGYGFVCFSVTGLYLRYLVGLIAPASVAIALVVSEVAASSALLARILYGVVAVVLAANFAAFLSIRNTAQPYPIVAALTESLDGSSMYYHARFKLLFSEAAARLGRDSTGLVVDSPALYLAETRVVSTNWFYPTLNGKIGAAKTPDELFRLLFRQEGIAYIVMPLAMKPTGFGDPEFLKRLILLDKTADFGLFVPVEAVGETPGTPGA